jgi:hypothetical protein
LHQHQGMAAGTAQFITQRDAIDVDEIHAALPAFLFLLLRPVAGHLRISTAPTR